MDEESLDRGVARTAAQLRMQLAQMTMVSQRLEQLAVDAEGREHLAMLNQSICRMMRIVGRMELTDRLGAEDPQVDLAVVDLARLVGELGEEMTSLLAGIGIQLEIRCPERLLGLADEALIKQMLLELVSNGAKAGSRVTVTLSRQGDSARFSVADNGSGVPPEQRNAMFSGGGQEAPDWRRTGNGVVVARRIAALHGGHLDPSSTRENGMDMVAVIPLRMGEAGRLESPALQWDRGGFSEVLVGLSDLLPAKAFAPRERKD